MTEHGLKPRRGAPHAFVVMPFGQKEASNGQVINFDSVYEQLIKPAVVESGFEPLRADEEVVSGDILTDMFQELLLADLVIADLSIDNANVFYELGVRHALRKQGVVHIQSGRAYMPFDIFNVRTIPYNCGEDGKPDPDCIDDDKAALVKVIRGTWASSHEHIHSPVFNLLSGLIEPDRKMLQTPLAVGYWQEYREWKERITIATRRKRVGDILLLTEEVHNPLIVEEAIAQAGRALGEMGHHVLALEQYQRGLEINPRSIKFRREEAFHLGQLNRTDEAIIKLERLIDEDLVDDPKAIAFLGRLYKDVWVNEWQDEPDEKARLKAAYEADEYLKRSINTYVAAYSQDHSHYYSGISALTLSMLLDHLSSEVGQEDDADLEMRAIKRQLPSLQGAIRFTLEQQAKKNKKDLWIFATLGNLAVNTGKTPQSVTRAYKKTLALGGRNESYINATLAHLKMLEALAFRVEFVQAGLAVLQNALDKLRAEAKQAGTDLDPPKVFLFAGHSIDKPDRKNPRFPPDMEDEARQKLDAALDELEAAPKDLAITPGVACGGDILFIEACLQRKMKVNSYVPLPEAEYIERWVDFPKERDSNWVERFYQIDLNPNVTFHVQPDRLGPVPAGDTAFERNHRWALYSARAYDIKQIRFVILWDGKFGDGPSGTSNMVRVVRQAGGIVKHLNTTEFDSWQKGIKKAGKTRA